MSWFNKKKDDSDGKILERYTITYESSGYSEKRTWYEEEQSTTLSDPLANAINSLIEDKGADVNIKDVQIEKRYVKFRGQHGEVK